MNDLSRAAKTREVAPGIIEVFLPLPSKPSIVNTWLVDCGGDEWAAIDTGVALAPSREAFRAALAELGVEPAQIRSLVATHHHPDHFGASRLVREETGCRVYFHPLEVERVEIALAAEPGDMLRHFRSHGMPVAPDAPACDCPAPSNAITMPIIPASACPGTVHSVL